MLGLSLILNIGKGDDDLECSRQGWWWAGWMSGWDGSSKLNKPEKEEDRSGGHRPHVPHLVTLKHFDFYKSLFQNIYFRSKSLNWALKRNEFSVLRLSFFLASVMHFLFDCPPDCVKKTLQRLFSSRHCAVWNPLTDVWLIIGMSLFLIVINSIGGGNHEMDAKLASIWRWVGIAQRIRQMWQLPR